MSKCKHRTELVCVTRRHITIQEVNEDLWNDYIVGLKCRDCPEEMPMPAEILMTQYPYRGKPHYPVVSEKQKPLPEMGICLKGAKMPKKTKKSTLNLKEFYEKATLFCECDKDSGKAFRLITDNHIPCFYIGTSPQTFDRILPCLFYGFQKYEGFKKIEKFVKRWRNKNQ